jgi:Zn-dependent peptidase ImmA (M78 family)
MNVPSVIRKPFVPPRRDEIAALAAETRTRYAGKSIDAIAEDEHLLLIRQPDPNTTKEGFCCVLPRTRRKRLTSSARPDTELISFAEEEKTFINAIIINPCATNNQEEVFWHEYYHLLYSPSRSGVTFYGGYSSGGVLDKQEEGRANLFAAFILMPDIEEDDTIYSLAEKFDVSLEIASARLRVR